MKTVKRVKTNYILTNKFLTDVQFSKNQRIQNYEKLLTHCECSLLVNRIKYSIAPETQKRKFSIFFYFISLNSSTK